MPRNAAQIGSQDAPVRRALTNDEKAEVWSRSIEEYGELYRDLELMKRDMAAKRQEIGEWQKRAKNDGVDANAVKVAVKFNRRDADEVISEHRHVVYCLHLMKGPVGEQFDLFQADATRRILEAKLDGFGASKNGESSGNNPHRMGTEPYAKWHEGWIDGQKQRAEEMADRPKRGRPPKKKDAEREAALAAAQKVKAEDDAAAEEAGEAEIVDTTPIKH